MQRELSETADFYRCAERNRSFEGDWPVARFERLKPVLNTDQGKVHAKLTFGERSGIAYLKAELSTDLDMICQRCAQPMIQHVESGFLFGFIRNEDKMDSLPDDMEPLLVVADDEQSMLDLVEDELLLSLPQVNAHAEECSDYLQQQNKRQTKDKMASSPFAVLKNLMSDKT